VTGLPEVDTSPAVNGTDRDPLIAWATDQKKITPRRFRRAPSGLRFAFYGRVSTIDYQDRASSSRWQRESATELINGHGRIVVEFFDDGVSRRVAWPDRPQAALLLSAIADPGRGFDAIVVGEYERAFTGEQFTHLAPILHEHGVALWLPETNGPVDFTNARHLALIDLLGVRSQREISRARFRTTAAMRAQAEFQGRHLGGRPPYGYRLVDAGPHPNTAHARWGRRLHRLDPDPATAPNVRWIFHQRLAGWSIGRIARDLNERGVPCPSGADPDRNRHRTGHVWMITTVAAILANPRYTGRQVWNRQPTTRNPTGWYGELAGVQEVQQRAPSSQWVISQTLAHPALVSVNEFVRAQAIHTAPVPADGQPRTYVLGGLVVCGICGRQMDAHWVHDRPGYRCRHGRTTAHPASPTTRKILYVREDQLLERIRGDRRLCRLLPQFAGIDPEEIGGYLRTSGMIVVCDHSTWVIESDSIRIELAPAGIPGFMIPTQLRAPPEESERSSRSVWK
jgi:site-specific DNA recombinase